MPNLNLLFEGATRQPAREFVGLLWQDGSYTRGIVPAVGRFTIPAALRAAGAKPDQLHTSDVSLFSSVIGFLLDPSRDLDELGVEISGDARRFTERPKDDLDYGAGVLLAQKWIQVEPSNLYTAAHRTEWWINRRQYRSHIRDQLAALRESIGGLHYEVTDAREVLAQRMYGSWLVFINPPGYKGGYRSMYAASEEELRWKGIEVPPLEPEHVVPLLEEVADSPATILAFLKGEIAEELSRSWTPLLGLESKLYGWTGTVTDYLVANRPLERRRAVLREPAGRNPRRLPIYDDEEITPGTEVAFLPTDKNTALYYRDLFVHRLGSTAARNYFLCLLDGRVITSLGLSWVEVLRGKREYVSETFGITKTSQRYARLGKLFMLLLTSTDMRDFLESHVPALALRPIRGVETSSITEHHEGKTDRGVMKLVSRDPLPHGGFRLTYRADWRDETWPETVERWLDQWGHIRRSDG